MDYNELLYNLSYFNIPINIITDTFYYDCDKNNLNKALFSLISKLSSNDLINCVTSVIITKESMYIDIDKLINKLCNIYKIEKNEKINKSVDYLLHNTSDRQLAFKYSTYLQSISNNHHEHINISTLLYKTKNDLNILKQLISNKEKYSKIDTNMINIEKLKLLLAYVVMNNCKNINKKIKKKKKKKKKFFLKKKKKKKK